MQTRSFIDATQLARLLKLACPLCRQNFAAPEPASDSGSMYQQGLPQHNGDIYQGLRAASEGDLATLKRLLHSGADHDALTPYGITPLHLAADGEQKPTSWNGPQASGTPPAWFPGAALVEASWSYQTLDYVCCTAATRLSDGTQSWMQPFPPQYSYALQHMPARSS